MRIMSASRIITGTIGAIAATAAVVVVAGAAIEADHTLVVGPNYNQKQKSTTADFVMRLVATPYPWIVKQENKILNAVGAPSRKPDVPDAQKNPSSAKKERPKHPKHPQNKSLTEVTYKTIVINGSQLIHG